jgi:hypothetical protein
MTCWQCKKNHILDSQRCEIIMNLSNHKGNKSLETLFKTVQPLHRQLWNRNVFLSGRHSSALWEVSTISQLNFE